MRRAEAAGYRAIMLTVDDPVYGWRPRDRQRRFLPQEHGHGLANYYSDPVFNGCLSSPPEQDPAGAFATFLGMAEQPPTFADVEWLRATTRLKLFLKGILHPDDARRALDCGVDGIVVSNHGGRQHDGCIAAIDALPRVAAAVGDSTTLLLDSGVRSGTDVLKALALGAAAVLIGRPYVYGLAVDGERGVATVLRRLIAELDGAMAMCGLSDVQTVSQLEVVRD